MMAKQIMESSFEIGPIRPPSEAYSLLIRVTRNCPWNRCMFCHTYKGSKFQLRSVEEIKQDIEAAKAIQDEIVFLRGLLRRQQHDKDLRYKINKTIVDLLKKEDEVCKEIKRLSSIGKSISG